MSQATLGLASGGQVQVAADVARRFGTDKRAGWRLNAALRDGGTAVDDEKARLGLVSLGVDWRGTDLRLSGDIGWQDNRLKRTRTNVSLPFDATAVPAPPDASSNFAQPWSYSNERDVFGTFRAEWDVARDLTAYAAYGLRRSEEANSLANLSVTDVNTGAGDTSRFDNTREDQVDTGELGLRGTLRTGPVGHDWVVSAGWFRLEKNNASEWDFFNTLPTNLYTPTAYPLPPFSGGGFSGNELASPAPTGRTRLLSVAAGDTLGLLDDTLLVTLGLRHQRIDIADHAYDTQAAANRYTRSRNSPVAGVVWKLGKPLSVYANYVEGLTQGETAPTFTTPAPSNAGEALPPYVSKQREVGLKFDTGRLGGSVAVFSTTKPRSLITAANVFTSEGEDRHQGVELATFGYASTGLKLLGGGTWLDAEQRRTGTAATEGKRVIGVPRRQANVGVEWAVPALDGLALDARLVHTGSSYADAANTLEVPGWTRLDLGVRYLADIGQRLVTLRARIDNATDRDHWASVGGFPGSGYLVVGAPRTVSVSASVEF